MAQLVDWLLSTPEIHSLNPDIRKLLSTNCSLEKTKIKKRHGMAHLKKVNFCSLFLRQQCSIGPIHCLRGPGLIPESIQWLSCSPVWCAEGKPLIKLLGISALEKKTKK